VAQLDWLPNSWVCPCFEHLFEHHESSYHFQREVELARNTIRHRNVVTFYGVVDRYPNVYIMMEIASCSLDFLQRELAQGPLQVWKSIQPVSLVILV
jgi:hypothetical protein